MATRRKPHPQNASTSARKAKPARRTKTEHTIRHEHWQWMTVLAGVLPVLTLLHTCEATYRVHAGKVRRARVLSVIRTGDSPSISYDAANPAFLSAARLALESGDRAPLERLLASIDPSVKKRVDRHAENLAKGRCFKGSGARAKLAPLRVGEVFGGIYHALESARGEVKEDPRTKEKYVALTLPIVALPAHIAERLDAEIAALRKAPPGGGNDQLYRSAFFLGKLVGDDPPVEVAVSVALVDAATPDRPKAEARATVRSGIEAGKREPDVAQPITRTKFVLLWPPDAEKWAPSLWDRYCRIHKKRPVYDAYDDSDPIPGRAGTAEERKRTARALLKDLTRACPFLPTGAHPKGGLWEDRLADRLAESDPRRSHRHLPRFDSRKTLAEALTADILGCSTRAVRAHVRIAKGNPRHSGACACRICDPKSWREIDSLTPPPGKPARPGFTQLTARKAMKKAAESSQRSSLPRVPSRRHRLPKIAVE